MHQDPDGVWTILNDEDQQLALEQLDSEGRDWFADGPGGAEAGALSDVLAAAAGPNAKTGWIDAVVAAIGRQVASGHRGSPLLVIPGDGVWYDATASRNRRSIQQHGLDWSRMVPPGIAGSHAAEAAGVFLCSDLEGAEWFAGMCRDTTVDIWSATLHDGWLESAPAGGGGAHWVICPHVIPPPRSDLSARTSPEAAADPSWLPAAPPSDDSCVPPGPSLASGRQESVSPSARADSRAAARTSSPLGRQSEVLSVRGKLLVLDAAGFGDRAATLFSSARSSASSAARPSAEMWWGRTRRPWLSGCG